MLCVRGSVIIAGHINILLVQFYPSPLHLLPLSSKYITVPSQSVLLRPYKQQMLLQFCKLCSICLKRRNVITDLTGIFSRYWHFHSEAFFTVYHELTTLCWSVPGFPQKCRTRINRCRCWNTLWEWEQWSLLGCTVLTVGTGALFELLQEWETRSVLAANNSLGSHYRNSDVRCFLWFSYHCCCSYSFRERLVPDHTSSESYLSAKRLGGITTRDMPWRTTLWNFSVVHRVYIYNLVTLSGRFTEGKEEQNTNCG